MMNTAPTNKAKPSRYPEFRVRGTPREMGRQIGEATGPQVRGFCEIALQRVNKTTPVTVPQARDIANRSLELAERYREDFVEELKGVAEAARVSLTDLMILQVRNQFVPPEKDGGCTSLSAVASNHQCTVAQTWDNDPVLDEFTIVLQRNPVDGPATLTCTQAGLIAYMGFGEHGIGACVNTLPAPSRSVGVPHYFTLRELLEADSLHTATEAVSRAHRAIPANIMLATPQGPATLEVTVDDVFVLTPGDGSVITHTNHCLHENLTEIRDTHGDLIQSFDRKRRIDHLVSSSTGETESIKTILRDHDGFPTSICRHANQDPNHGFWETVFALIIEPSERRFHVSRGNPCCNDFETYELLSDESL